MELKMYVIRSKDGKYFKSKGYQGIGASWRDEIGQAKVYPKPGPARGQITWWVTNYPEFGVPDLIELTITEGNMRVLDEGKRISKVKNRKEKREKERIEQETKQKAIRWWGGVKSVRQQVDVVKKWAEANGKENIHPDDITQNQIVELYKFNKKLV